MEGGFGKLQHQDGADRRSEEDAKDRPGKKFLFIPGVEDGFLSEDAHGQRSSEHQEGEDHQEQIDVDDFFRPGAVDQPFVDHRVLIEEADQEENQESDRGDEIKKDVNQIEDADGFLHDCCKDSLLSSGDKWQ